MSDKRSVSTDALATLGTIIDASQKRDAIHLAVEPVIASCTMKPGDHITITDGVAYPAKVGLGLGIVDPFLIVPVEEGQRFWFIMYPRQVQSLRHVWTHPAFPDEPGVSAPPLLTSDEPPILSRLSPSDKAASVSWLRQYARRVNSYLADEGDKAYETLMEDIRSRSLTYHGTEMHSIHELHDPEELQKHASIVLGYTVIWSNFEYFSCTC